MSLTLHRFGLHLHDHARRALALTGVIVAGLLVVMALWGGTSREVYTVPGSEAQSALDTLAHRFPEVSRSSADLVIQAPDDGRVDRTAVQQVVTRARQVPGVTEVIDPYADGVTGAVSRDGTTAVVTAQLDKPSSEVDDATREALHETGDPLRAKGYTVEAGGSAFGLVAPEMSLMELAGVAVALGVLLAFFRSGWAAASPVVSAAAGVAATLAVIGLLSALTDVSSSSSLLAVMIGMAVGIDYALFLIHRFRELTRDPAVSVREAVALTTATAGSAVVFAALTVLIALAAMAVVALPFLTVMGISAAVGVLMALVATLLVTPCLLALWGGRIRPRADASPRTRRLPVGSGNGWESWVTTVTRVPLLTVVLVVGALGALALPARDLAFALPNAGDAATATTQRKAYDLIEQKLGPGQNGPLLVSVDLIATTDPVGVMNRLGRDLGTVDGVERVALSTPNRSGEMGVVVLIPTTGPHDPATRSLVNRIRDMEPALNGKFDVTTQVTGATAVQLDVSSRLGDAVLPYCLIVVGLCLLLMTMVFRSLVVPLTAAVGYLLSLGATMGVLSLIFDGGPLISFLPVIVMGVLFGLAMDYQVFLVSRMHEDLAHNGSHRDAIVRGFVSSAPVVAAAAVIMVAVFASFIPHGDAVTRPIAVALTVGVAVDAFIVRMVLVPALLALVGRRSWSLPAALAGRLPDLDVEGAGIARVLARPASPDSPAVQAISLGIDGPAGPVVRDVSWEVQRGGVGVVVGPEGAGKTTFLLAVAGRLAFQHGSLRVLGHLLPEEATTVERRAGLAEIPGVNDLEPGMDLDHHVAERYAAFRLEPWAKPSDLDHAQHLFHQLLKVAGTPSTATGSTRVADLSSVERTAFGLALACLERPDLIVVDHQPLPTEADEDAFWRMVLHVDLDWDPTLLVVTHEPPRTLPARVRRLDLPAPAAALASSH